MDKGPFQQAGDGNPADAFFALKGHGNQPIEFDFVTGETARMSKETTVLWQELVERATNEVEKK